MLKFDDIGILTVCHALVCIETAQHILSSAYSSPIILVFPAIFANF